MTPIRDYAIEPKPQTHYVIIHETPLSSGVASALLLIALGWALGLVVLQWFGAAAGVLIIGSRLFQPDDVYRADNIDDAYRILDMLDEDAQEGGL